MTRKGFFRTLFGLGAASPVVAVDVTTHKDGWKRFIPWRWQESSNGGDWTNVPIRRVVTVSDCRNGRYVMGTKVFLDGVPVSDECCFAEVCDDGFGRVILYLRNGDGKFFVARGPNGLEAAKVTRFGRVRILRPYGMTAEQWERLQKEWLRA